MSRGFTTANNMEWLPLEDRSRSKAYHSCDVDYINCPPVFRRPQLVSKNLGVFNWQEKSPVGQHRTVCYQYVWATIDNCLYIWEVLSTGADGVSADDEDYDLELSNCTVLDQLDQAITAVHLMPAKSGVFEQDSVTLLVVATTVDIILFRVERDSNAGKLQLTPTDFFTSSDHISMTKIVSDTSGRIFMSGSDGYLYELDYRKSNFWDNINGNCDDITCAKRRVSRYEVFLEMLPPFVSALFFVGRRDIVDMCYDAEDNAIFLLMMDGATVRRIALDGSAVEQQCSAHVTGRRVAKGTPTAPRVPRAMYLLDREHPFRREEKRNMIFKLAVVMHDGDIVYILMHKGTKRLRANETQAKSRPTGAMVAQVFNSKQTTIIATTRPADGPLNRLQYVTTAFSRVGLHGPCRFTHIVTGEAMHDQPSSLIDKVYAIACVQNPNATAVEKLYWHFNGDSERRQSKSKQPFSSSGGGGSSGSSSSSYSDAKWDYLNTCLSSHITYCKNGKHSMDYCPDPLLRISKNKFLVVGETKLRVVTVQRLLDERLELQSPREINDFLSRMLNSFKKKNSPESRLAARNYICILLIIICCHPKGNENRMMWNHLRDLFTHQLFYDEDYTWNDEQTYFDRNAENDGVKDQFFQAVLVFIAQVLYRIASIPFRHFTVRCVEGENTNGQVPKKVVEDFVTILEKLLQLLLHPGMFEIKRKGPQIDDYSFRENYPQILELLQYLIQIFKFLQVAEPTSGKKEATAFFNSTIMDLLNYKTTVKDNCKEAIMETIAEFSRKDLTSEVNELDKNVIQGWKHVTPHFKKVDSSFLNHPHGPTARIVKESEFMLQVATKFTGDNDAKFQHAKEQKDFSYEYLEAYCEKIYTHAHAKGVRGGVHLVGSVEKLVKVAKEMLDAASNSNIDDEKCYDYVSKKLFHELAAQDDNDAKRGFLSILEHAERIGKPKFKFFDKYVYKYFFGNKKIDGELTEDQARKSDRQQEKRKERGAEWILSYYDAQKKFGSEHALRHLAWDKNKLLDVLEEQTNENVHGQLPPETLLLTFCRRNKTTSRSKDQREAAALLQQCAYNEEKRILLATRIHCLQSAINLLQDQSSDKEVRAFQQKLEAAIEIAKIQHKLEPDSTCKYSHLKSPGEVYRLASRHEKPLEKLRVIAAEGRQSPRIEQIWDDLLSRTEKKNGYWAEQIEDWVKHLYNNRLHPSNVFRLDKIIRRIVETHSKPDLKMCIKALVGDGEDGKVQFCEIWKQVKQKQFDHSYDCFGLQFISLWLDAQSNKTARSDCKQYAIQISQYLRNCGANIETLQPLREKLEKVVSRK